MTGSDVRPELQQIREALGYPAYGEPGFAALARVEDTLNEQTEQIAHHGEPPTVERIKVAHSKIEAEWLEANWRGSPIYKQSHGEECYICALIFGLEAADARVVAAEAEIEKAHNAMAHWLGEANDERDARVAAEAERDALRDTCMDALDFSTGWSSPMSDRERLECITKILSEALAVRVSATGASVALQDPARPAPAEPPRDEGGRFADGGSVEFTLTPDGWVETARTERAEPPERQT